MQTETQRKPEDTVREYLRRTARLLKRSCAPEDRPAAEAFETLLGDRNRVRRMLRAAAKSRKTA